MEKKKKKERKIPAKDYSNFQLISKEEFPNLTPESTDQWNFTHTVITIIFTNASSSYCMYLEKVHLVAFDIAQQIQIQVGFGFPNCIMGSVAVFLQGYLLSVPAFAREEASKLLYAAFLCPEFHQEQLVHPCRLPRISAWLPAHEDGLSLSLEVVILDYDQLCLTPLTSRAPSHGTLSSKSLKRAKSALLCFH